MSKAATQVFTQASQDNNEAFDFPDGWVEINIGSVVDLNPGKPPADAVPHDAYVTFVPMPAVDAYSGKITAPKDRPFGAVRKGYTAFQEDDVIFAKITPCMENGKAAIARNLTNGLGFGSTEFHVLRSTRAVIPEYLYYYIRQESFRRNAEAEMTGSVGQRRVPVEFIKNSLLPLPPLAEQKRIVAKVEELLTRVNAARERLAKVREILKRFRQSVLSAACSGRLTADWRNQQSNIQHASNLLSSMLAERHQAQKTANVKRQNSSESLHFFQATQDIELPDLEELPDGWVWTFGAHLFTWSSGKFLPKKRQVKGPYTIYGGNGVTGYHSEYLVNFPTLVIGRVGALCGNVYITPGKAWVTDNAIYATHVPRKLNLRYVYMVFTQANLNANAGGSGQPFVNQGVLNEVPVPLPPLAEQDEIVRRVEALFKLADAIEKRFETAVQHAEKLTQAILAKAFRGDLVPTEAELARLEGRSYEPASALLAKIKAQQRDVKPQRKRGRALQRKNDISGLTS